MNRVSLWNTLRVGVLLCPALFVTPAVAQSANALAQPAKPVISLDPSEPPNAASVAPMKGEASFANAPANFHSFPSAGVGEDTYAERLHIAFRSIDNADQDRIDQRLPGRAGKQLRRGEDSIRRERPASCWFTSRRRARAGGSAS